MTVHSLALPRLAAAAALAIACHGAFAAGTEMVVNGSFESPNYGATGVYAGSGDGWTKSFEGPVSIIHGNIRDGYNHLYGRTTFGAQYLGLDPRSQTGFYASDSQTIPGFVAGQQYLISLFAADSDGGKAPVLEVSLNNDAGKNYFDKSFDLPVGGPYYGTIQFTRLQAVFTSPVTGPITLTLRNSGVNFPVNLDPGSISIDEVSIKPVTAQEADALQAAAAGPSSSFAR